MEYKLSNEEINKYRPKPFFFINTCDMAELTPRKIEERLLRLKDCGFGGFILFNKPPVGFVGDDYLSEGWFEMVGNFAVGAKELGLEMWINDGYDYPPGNVGGKVEKIAPELTQQRITVEDGALKVVNVDWGFPAFENKRSGELFAELVYNEYEKHIGEFFGNTVVGFFSDGDNRRVLPPVMFDESHPCRDYFPWCDDFAESFKEKYGYDILEYMVRIINREDIPKAADYWEHSGAMYQRWFASNARWMKSHGLLYTGHTSDSAPLIYADAPRSSALTEGRFSDIQSIFDYPGTDQELLALDGGKHMCIKNWYSPTAVWGGEAPLKMTGFYDVTEDTRAKQAGSTAYLFDKKEVMCEMFAATNFGVSPRELKAISTFQIMQGVTMVVPHAYHYRFCGPIKYFAPPEFSERGMIGKYIKELNEEIASLAALMSKGESICPVVLIDPTEAVWRNNFDSAAYLEAFAQLNRLPYGFVIGSWQKALTMDFAVAVVSGFELDDAAATALRDKGVRILYGDELDKIGELVSCDVRFEGVGTPHYVRKMIDGQEFTFVANVENEENVKGILFAYGRTFDIDLINGEVVYVSADFDNVEKHIEGIRVCDIPENVDVKFSDENVIPIERFENSMGEAIVKGEAADSYRFSFTCSEDIKSVKLYVPEYDISVRFNGGDIGHYEKENVYDDRYHVFVLECSEGVNNLEISKDTPFESFDRIFIKGDFDVELYIGETAQKTAFSVYNISLKIPDIAQVKLLKRRNKLSPSLSWAEQGQPFYSGETEYIFVCSLDEGGRYRLDLKNVRDVASVWVNDACAGKRIKAPYLFEFDGVEGINRFKVRVTNSLANAFECYKEKSGLLERGIIEKI